MNNAFLNGSLAEEVYTQQPPGFIATDTSLVCKLNKAIYGLKQAPRAWFERLASTLHMFGFHTSKCDPSLFTLTKPTYTIFMLVYVDDIIVTGNSSSHIQQLVSQLHEQFSLRQLGQLDYFLGIEVPHLSNGGLFLSQTKYIRSLLAKTNMSDVKSLLTPMVTNLKLTRLGSNYLQDPTYYRSVVGALEYATITRPEISYAVNKACQFVSQPLQSHWVAVKRILRYLRCTLQHGLQLLPASPSSPIPITAFSNTDWGSDPDDRKSTSGSCLYLGPNLVS